MKRWMIALTLAVCVSSSQSAAADTPSSPRKASISDLIKTATYDRVPIRLNEFTLTNTRSVVNKQRLDFELTYDVNYWDLVAWFETHYKEKQPVSILDPDIFPNAKAPELRVYGKSGAGDQMNFTLGNPELPYRFDIRLRPNEQSKAVVTVHNAINSMIYSGLMPARAPFAPAGKTNTIPFRWN